MGAFNSIRPDPCCPACEGDMDWQTKNLFVREYPIALCIIMIDLEPDMSGEAHTDCGVCNKWYEATIECGKVEIVWDERIKICKPPRSYHVGKRYMVNGKIRERKRNL